MTSDEESTVKKAELCYHFLSRNIIFYHSLSLRIDGFDSRRLHQPIEIARYLLNYPCKTLTKKVVHTLGQVTLPDSKTMAKCVIDILKDPTIQFLKGT
jgi:hypothetical protein